MLDHQMGPAHKVQHKDHPTNNYYFLICIDN